MISISETIAEKEYNTFILKDKNTLFYHSLKYHNFLKKYLACRTLYFSMKKNNQLQAIIPFMYKEDEIGSVFNSLPYYGSNGAFIVDPELSEAEKKEYKTELYQSFTEYFQNRNVLSCTIITNPLQNDELFFADKLKLNYTDFRIGQFTDLSVSEHFDEKDILRKFDKIRSRNIRRAQKTGMKISIENNQESIKFLYETHRDNIEKIGGRAKEYDFFRMIPEYFNDSEYSLYLAKLNNKPIGALLLFFYNNTVEYFTPATNEYYRADQPSSLIIYQAMLDSINKGYKSWNWGGTWETQKGVYEFKNKWGAKDYQYHYYTQIYNQDFFKYNLNMLTQKFKNFYLFKY